MKTRTLTKIILIAGFLCSCISIPPNDPMPKPKSSDSATLYVFRSDGFMRMADAASIYINGNHIGQLKSKTYMKIEVDPGLINIAMYSSESTEHQVSANKKKEYCFSFERNVGEIAVNQVLGPLSSSVVKTFVLRQASCEKFKRNIVNYTQNSVAYESN